MVSQSELEMLLVALSPLLIFGTVEFVEGTSYPVLAIDPINEALVSVFALATATIC